MTDPTERLTAAVEELTAAVKANQPAPEPESEADFYRRLLASKGNEHAISAADFLGTKDAA